MRPEQFDEALPAAGNVTSVSGEGGPVSSLQLHDAAARLCSGPRLRRSLGKARLLRCVPVGAGRHLAAGAG